MYVLRTIFDGWTLHTRTFQHPVSLPSQGVTVFEMQVREALDDPDVYRVQLVTDEGHIDREIVFNDRRFARED